VEFINYDPAWVASEIIALAAGFRGFLSKNLLGFVGFSPFCSGELF
jgi:hypothetical protein